MKTKHWRTTVPIYGGHVLLSVSDDACVDSKNFHKAFPEAAEAKDDFYAACFYHKSNFAIFLSKSVIEQLEYEILTHEIFHLTRRIMDYHGAKFEIESHEPFALLHEWLTKWVFSKMLPLFKIRRDNRSTAQQRRRNPQ